MNFKTTSVLFALLIAMLFVFGLTLAWKHRDLDKGFVLPKLAEDNTLKVDALEVKTKDGADYAFALKGEQWYLTNLPGFKGGVRVQNPRIEEMIKQIRTARKSDEPYVTRNQAEWGLDAPERTFILRLSDGQEAKLSLGKTSPVGDYVYVSSSERPRDVLAVPKNTINDLFFKDINELRSRQLLEVNENTAQEVDLREKVGGKSHVLILKKNQEALWHFVEPKLGPADFEGDLSKPLEPGARQVRSVKDLLTILGAIVVEDFEPAGRQPFDANNALLTITVQREVGKGTTKETLYIGPKVSGQDKEKGQYYARLSTDEGVVRVSAARIDPLLKVVDDPAKLRSHDLTQLSLARPPDRIQIRKGPGLKEEINLYRPGNDWEVVTPSKRMKANQQAVGEQGLIGALQGKRQIKTFLDDPRQSDEQLGLDAAKPGPNGPEAVVEVFENSLEFPKANDTKEKDKGKSKGKEKDKGVAQPNPKAKPVVTLTFSREDKSEVKVKRVTADGGVTRFTMTADVLDKVTQGPLAYLDTTLPTLPESIAKLELKRNLPESKVDFIVKLEKKKKKDKDGKDTKESTEEWVLEQPKDLPGGKADQQNVENVLNQLHALTVKKWVEKALNPKNPPYGLASPAITVIAYPEKKAGEKDEPKPMIYKFGSEVTSGKDKGDVYAMLGGDSDTGELSGLIFLVDKASFDALKTVELRDRTVLKFEPAKIKEVKVSVLAGKTPLDGVFKRADKSWNSTGQRVLAFAPQKVDALLGQLKDLKAERYEMFNARGKESGYGLGEDAPLKITLVLDDAKAAPITLTVGNQTADKSGYYARASTLPDVIFVVKTAEFTPLLGGLDFFSRGK